MSETGKNDAILIGITLVLSAIVIIVVSAFLIYGLKSERMVKMGYTKTWIVVGDDGYMKYIWKKTDKEICNGTEETMDAKVTDPASTETTMAQEPRTSKSP